MCTHAHPAGCVRTSTQTNLLNSDQGSVSYKNQLYNEQCPVTKNSSGKMTLINMSGLGVFTGPALCIGCRYRAHTLAIWVAFRGVVMECPRL